SYRCQNRQQFRGNNNRIPSWTQRLHPRKFLQIQATRPGRVRLGQMRTLSECSNSFTQSQNLAPNDDRPTWTAWAGCRPLDRSGVTANRLSRLWTPAGSPDRLTTVEAWTRS